MGGQRIPGEGRYAAQDFLTFFMDCRIYHAQGIWIFLERGAIRRPDLAEGTWAMARQLSVHPVLRKFRTARSLPARVLLLIAPVWLLIGLSTLAIRMVPMRRLVRGFGAPLGAVGFSPLSDARQIACARDLQRAIGIAAKYAPFRADCLPQAMAGLTIGRLSGIPCALHFGVSIEKGAQTDDGGFAAHAWLVSGPVAISGGSGSFDRFSVINCWVSRRHCGAVSVS